MHPTFNADEPGAMLNDIDQRPPHNHTLDD